MEYFLGIFFIVLAFVLHGVEGLGDAIIDVPLVHDFYKETCPLAEEIVRRHVEYALLKDPRMAAPLLRLHFHDCFVLVITRHSQENMSYNVSLLLLENVTHLMHGTYSVMIFVTILFGGHEVNFFVFSFILMVR